MKKAARAAGKNSAFAIHKELTGEDLFPKPQAPAGQGEGEEE